MLARYVEAFEQYDIEALTSLIQEDASQSMPPFDMWLAGRDDILTWWFGPGIGCKGSRVVPTTSANGSPAFGQYKPSARRRLRAVGAPGARALRRADRRVHVLPRHRDALPALRAAAAARRVGRPRARRTRSARRGHPMRCAGRRPGRACRAATCRRARSATVPTSGSASPLVSQTSWLGRRTAICSGRPLRTSNSSVWRR